jgi:hypothetical protein
MNLIINQIVLNKKLLIEIVRVVLNLTIQEIPVLRIPNKNRNFKTILRLNIMATDPRILFQEDIINLLIHLIKKMNKND